MFHIIVYMSENNILIFLDYGIILTNFLKIHKKFVNKKLGNIENYMKMLSSLYILYCGLLKNVINTTKFETILNLINVLCEISMYMSDKMSNIVLNGANICSKIIFDNFINLLCKIIINFKLILVLKDIDKFFNNILNSNIYNKILIFYILYYVVKRLFIEKLDNELNKNTKSCFFESSKALLILILSNIDFILSLLQNKNEFYEKV